MTAGRRFCDRCKTWYRSEVFGDHLCQIPDDGHTFRLEVTSRMSSRVEEPGKPRSSYSDADWWGPPLVLEVRAWNQRDALTLAATRPLGEWSRDGHRLDEELPPAPDPVEPSGPGQSNPPGRKADR